MSILLDYLGTLVANGQCEAFGVDVDGTHACYLTVRRGSSHGCGLVWTLQSLWSDVFDVTNATDTLDAAVTSRAVRSATYPSGEASAILDTRLPAGMGSDSGTISVIYRRWREMRNARDAERGGSRLWVRMNGLNRGHSAASMRALGVLVAGADHRWVYPGPLALVEVTLDQAWDNWNDNATRLAAEYLQSLSLALSARLSAGPALPAAARCLLLAS